nr:quinohemoprotein amine dehydrogenase maturation protein [Sphingobium sp.]
MNAVHTPTYHRAEYHGFHAGGSAFVYLVNAGAIFEIDEQVQEVLDRIGGQELSHAALVRELADEGGDLPDAEALVRELRAAQLIHLGAASVSVPEAPPADFPLQALVLNITNQCNL